VYRWRGEGAWQQASWLKVAFLVVRWWECNVGMMYMLKLRDLEEEMPRGAWSTKTACFFS
jgi:hypothetical protein